MATHSSILAWRIPWTEEPCVLQSMGLQRIRHDWATEQQFLVISIVLGSMLRIFHVLIYVIILTTFGDCVTTSSDNKEAKRLSSARYITSNNKLDATFSHLRPSIFNSFFFFFFLAKPSNLQDFSSLTRDWTMHSGVEAQSPNYWTSRESTIFINL